MVFAPQVLLSNIARERCITNIKELPALMYGDVKRKTTASVLVPLCVDKGEVCLLYTLRSSNLKNHRGQVSFPGGKIDVNETEFDTALRETKEEIGVEPKDVDIWGKMPMVQGRDQNMIITPVVGLIKNFEMNRLVPSVHEVEEVFNVPVSALCNSEIHAHYEYQNIVLPVFLYGKYKIWGITGVITHWLLQCFLPKDIYKVDFTRRKLTLEELMPLKL